MILPALSEVGSASTKSVEITLLAGGPVRRIATQRQPVKNRYIGGIAGAIVSRR